MPTQQWPDPDFSLTPCTECGMVCRPAEFHPFAACLMFKGCHDGDKVRANLAALHPQPAPAVAVEAAKVDWYERHQDECTRDYGEYNDSASLAARLRWWVPKSARHGRLQLEDDLLEASEALAARSAPAVAEKVPLTDEQIDRALGITAGRNVSLEHTLREVFRAAERAHGIGSGSAQEGQAK
jgi:hypothetical protein